MPGEDAVIGGIFNLISQSKQKTALQKSANAFMQAYAMTPDPATGQPLGDAAYRFLSPNETKETFGHRSADDQIAAVQGFMEAQTVKRLVQDYQEREGRLKELADEQQAWQRVGEHSVSPGAPAQTIPSQFGGPPLAELPALNPSFDAHRFMAAAAQEPSVLRQIAPRIVPQMMQEGDESGPTAPPVQFPLEGGYVGYAWPGTKSREIRQDLSKFMGGTDEDGTMRAQPVLGPNGEVLSWRMPTGKGGSVAISRPKEPKELSATYLEKLADPDALPAQIRRARNAAQWSDKRISELADKPDPAAYRKSKLAEADALSAELANHFDTMESENIGKPETWEKLRKQYGLSKRSPTDDRVTVTKGGKQFTLPRAQLEAAKKQGYTLVGQ